LDIGNLLEDDDTEHMILILAAEDLDVRQYQQAT
jgi:hypothetical protein